MAIRYAVRVVQLGSAALLMGAACDGLRLPARPADTNVANVAETTPPRPAERPSPTPRRSAPRRSIPPSTPSGSARSGAGSGAWWRRRRRTTRRTASTRRTCRAWASSPRRAPRSASSGWHAPAGRRAARTRHAGARLRHLRGPGARAADDAPGRAFGEGRGTGVRCLAAGAPGIRARRRRPWPPNRRPRPPAAARSGRRSADTASALDAVSPSIQMRVDLRNLVRSQDTYFGLQGEYSRRTEPFALQYLWHRGVKITILSANDDSWSARATHLTAREELRHLARAGARSGRPPRVRSACRTEPAMPGLRRLAQARMPRGSVVAAAAPP